MNIDDQLLNGLISNEEHALRRSLPPTIPEGVIGSIAYGTAIIASAMALTLDGDASGADVVLKADLIGNSDDSPAVLVTAQIALGLTHRAVAAAAAGGIDAATNSIRQAAAIYQELADRALDDDD